MTYMESNANMTVAVTTVTGSYFYAIVLRESATHILMMVNGGRRKFRRNEIERIEK